MFETATPFDTPHEMEDLIAWTRKAIEEEALHPLLVAAVFIVTFLAIHPFQDGNGRLSRVLTTLLLLRAGYVYVLYASLERVIEENKDLYYKALRRTQTTLRGTAPDWEPWTGFFLRCLKKQKDSLAVRLDRERAAQEGEAELSEHCTTRSNYWCKSQYAEGSAAGTGVSGARPPARQGPCDLVFIGPVGYRSTVASPGPEICTTERQPERANPANGG